MKQIQPNYHSYLLRLWRSSDDDNAPWLVMLVNPHSEERLSFATIEEMLIFLQWLMNESAADSGSGPAD